jgi:hypothetical protein
MTLSLANEYDRGTLVECIVPVRSEIQVLRVKADDGNRQAEESQTIELKVGIVNKMSLSSNHINF